MNIEEVINIRSTVDIGSTYFYHLYQYILFNKATYIKDHELAKRTMSLDLGNIEENETLKLKNKEIVINSEDVVKRIAAGIAFFANTEKNIYSFIENNEKFEYPSDPMIEKSFYIAKNLLFSDIDVENISTGDIIYNIKYLIKNHFLYIRNSHNDFLIFQKDNEYYFIIMSHANDRYLSKLKSIEKGSDLTSIYNEGTFIAYVNKKENKVKNIEVSRALPIFSGLKYISEIKNERVYI